MRRDELTPPKGEIFVGGGDFEEIGEEFLRYFIELGELKSNERVLDVGCGIGRMAIPLTEYLDEEGSYEGFDIVAKGINWCREKITPKYPNFHFQSVDVLNKNYNPYGKHKASEHKFSYEYKSFDFIFLTSLFTHMLPQDMKNYFYEVTRVLKTSGRCLITFFLLNTESKKLVDENLSTLDFKYNAEGYRTINKNTPESAVAYNGELIRRLYEKYGLNIAEPIHYGSWCGREDFLSYQDIVIAVKK